MTLAEKIFASHDVDGKGFVRPGDMIRVSVDWVMASEASWGVSKPNDSANSWRYMLMKTEYGEDIRAARKTRDFPK